MAAGLVVDFIVVGAGSAGRALAGRLSRDGRHKVLVLEAGESDLSFWVRLPIGYGKLFYDARVNWKYLTEPVEALGGRQSYWPRGKVLGRIVGRGSPRHCGRAGFHGGVNPALQGVIARRHARAHMSQNGTCSENRVFSMS